jgi:hypothetical protein
VDLATVALYQRDDDRTRSAFREAIDMFRWIGNYERVE